MGRWMRVSRLVNIIIHGTCIASRIAINTERMFELSVTVDMYFKENKNFLRNLPIGWRGDSAC